MTEPSLESFFAGGGTGRSVSWKDRPIGSKVSGTIVAVHPPRQQTDPVTGEPQFKKNGEPKMSVRIDLQTDLRNWDMTLPPDDPNEVDDGMRGLYVQGWMQGAVGDALRKAGRNGPPEVGGTLTVTLTERTPNENRALNPINKFTAEYSSPSSQATSDFFHNDTAAPSNGLVRPAKITESAWNMMDDATKRAVVGTMSGGSDESPPF